MRRYRAELTAARDRREQLRRDLVGARERGELGLVWQPIVALADHRVTGVEALLRWQHPEHGDVPPEEFLPLAERAGLVVDLQRWMLHAATAAAATLPEHGPALKLGVNVSAQHVGAGTLVGDVTSALRESGLSPERLVVEIAESALTADGITDDVTALRLMGVHLALDDFGRGASSLPGLAGCRSTSSSWTGRCCPGWTGTPTRGPSARPWSPSARRCASTWSPRAWRPPASSASCRRWAAATPRASCSPVR